MWDKISKGDTFLKAIIFISILCVSDAKISRCIGISDAWRGPWPNGSESQYNRGKEFFDSSIYSCGAFGPQCESWVTFRPDRGQILCSHHAPAKTIYHEAWEHALRIFGSFRTQDKNQNSRAKDDISQSPDVIDRTNTLVNLSNNESNALYQRSLVNSDIKEEQNENLDISNQKSSRPFELENIQHLDLHSKTTSDFEDLAHLEHHCDASRINAIHCRLVPTSRFLELRKKPYKRSVRHHQWMREMFYWECDTTPSWTKLVGDGPICPPFYLNDENICVPIEHCVVVVDVKTSRPFDHQTMFIFVSILICSIGLILSVFYLLRNRPHKIREAMIKQNRQQKAREKMMNQRQYGMDYQTSKTDLARIQVLVTRNVQHR